VVVVGYDHGDSRGWWETTVVAPPKHEYGGGNGDGGPYEMVRACGGGGS